eukprot:2435263-Pyramimonas_sp.AAC.1
MGGRMLGLPQGIKTRRLLRGTSKASNHLTRAKLRLVRDVMQPHGPSAITEGGSHARTKRTRSGQAQIFSRLGRLVQHWPHGGHDAGPNLVNAPWFQIDSRERST